MVIIRAAALVFLSLMAGCTVGDTFTPSSSLIQLGYPQIPTEISLLPPPVAASRSDAQSPTQALLGRPVLARPELVASASNAARTPNTVTLDTVTLDAVALPSDNTAPEIVYDHTKDPVVTAVLLKPLSDAERERMFLDLADERKGHLTPPPPVVNLEDIPVAMTASGSEDYPTP